MIDFNPKRSACQFIRIQFTTYLNPLPHFTDNFVGYFIKTTALAAKKCGFCIKTVTEGVF